MALVEDEQSAGAELEARDEEGPVGGRGGDGRGRGRACGREAHAGTLNGHPERIDDASTQLRQVLVQDQLDGPRRGDAHAGDGQARTSALEARDPELVLARAEAFQGEVALSARCHAGAARAALGTIREELPMGHAQRAHEAPVRPAGPHEQRVAAPPGEVKLDVSVARVEFVPQAVARASALQGPGAARDGPEAEATIGGRARRGEPRETTARGARPDECELEPVEGHALLVEHAPGDGCARFRIRARARGSDGGRRLLDPGSLRQAGRNEERRIELRPWPALDHVSVERRWTVQRGSLASSIDERP